MNRVKYYIFTIFVYGIIAQPVKVSYPDREINKKINKQVEIVIQHNKKYLKLYDWTKYYEESFKNIDCYGKIHEGIIIYFKSKPDEIESVLAIYIEIIDGEYTVARNLGGSDIESVLDIIENTDFQFNAECLGH